MSVPILKPSLRPRPYVLATECADAISAVDPGIIDRVQVRNDGAGRVFLPLGTILEGRESPSRATAAGVVLDAAMSAIVPVKCVHASQAIHAGASLSLSPVLAPRTVAQALVTRDQGAVWASVARLSGVDGPHGPGSPDEPANLPRALARRPPDEPEMEALQCGSVLLDAEGVRAVEIFDHPDSWQAATRPRIPDASGGPSSTRLALNPQGASRIAKEFLRGLAGLRCHREDPQNWMADDGSAAFTVFDGEIIHLLAFGRPLVLPDSGYAIPFPGVAAPTFAPPAAFAPVGPSVEGPLDPGAADVAVASLAEADNLGIPEASGPTARPRRRKVLTSGWDSGTFASLERYAGKEFRGDRSAAIRFLVRSGLRRRGYMGPISRPRTAAIGPWTEPEETAPSADSERTDIETRIHDLERIVLTETYAVWLRQRARSELERMARENADERTRSAVHSALDRLPEVEVPAEEELPESPEAEVPPSSPPTPPVDVRPLLRRAFADSAGGHFPEALTLFDEVLLAEPDNRTALLGRAVALRRSGKTQEALDALGRVLEQEPTNAAALLNRGRILQEQGEFEGALEAFDALARVAPNDWDVWMVRGDVLARMGRDRDARAAYAEALRRNPEDEELQEKIQILERMQPAPAPTPLQRVPLPRELHEGQSYLVKERHPDLSLRVVRALMIRAVPAMLITTRSAETVRRESGLAGVRVLELSHAPGEGRHDPTALAALTQVVERFLRESHARGVVLLESVASLILENGFRETALFIERVNETVLQSHALFLVSIEPDDLEEREMALLERSFTVLS